MANTTSVKVELDGSSFKSEAQAMAQAIKTVGKETKATDAALQANGSAVERLENKYKGLQKQLQMQSQLSAKYAQAIKQSAAAQEQAKQKLDAANKAYADGKNIYASGSKELSKLEKEVLKQEKAFNRVTTAHERYKGKLSDSRSAESKFQTALKQTGAELEKQQKYMTLVNQEFTRLQTKSEKLRTGMTKTGRALTLGLTAPLVAAGVKVVKISEDFNRALANIGTLNVPVERLKELKTGIQDIAVSVGKDTTDIADGTYQVVSAYGDSAETLKMVEINAKAAAAGLATTTDTINLTSAVTKGYGTISGEATQKVSDLAFETVRLGQTTFPELAASMGSVVPQAKALGASQEELFAVFATLTGVTGNAAEVSTQLGSIWTALMKPSGEMTAALKKMGYESGFAAVSALGLQGTLEGLVNVTGKSDEELVKLAGRKEAVTAMLALTGAQADTFKSKLEQLGNAAGATDRAFKAQTEGVNEAGFVFQQAMIKMQVAAQNFGDSAAPFIEKGADAISGLSEWMKTLDDEDRERLMRIGVALAAIGPTLSVLSKGRTVLNGLSAGIKGLGVAGSTASKALGTSNGLLGTIAAIPGPAKAAVAALGLIGTVALVIKKGTEAAEDALYNYGDAAEEAIGAALGELSKTAELDDMIAEWRKLNQVVQAGTAPAEELTAAKERLKEVESWLNENYGKYMDGDFAATTKAEIDRLAQQNSLLRERAVLNAQIALQDAKESRKEAGEKIGSVQSKRDALKEENDALREQQVILKKHKAAWDSTMDSAAYKSADVAEQTRMQQEAVAALNDEIGKYGMDYTASGFGAGFESDLAEIGRQLDKNDEKITEYDRKLLDYKDSIIQEQQAARDLISGMLADAPTDSAESFSAVAGKIAQISKDAQLSAEDVAVFSEKLTEIAHAAGLLPEDVSIHVTAEGNIETLQSVEDATNELNGKTVTTFVNADGTQAYAEINGVTYAIASYDTKTGEALLTADGQAADMSINLATGQVRQFGREEGKAVLDAVDNASQKAKDAAAAVRNIPKTWKTTITTVWEKVWSALEFAKGTSNAPGGPAIINDEETKDPRELVVRNGKGYIFEGSNVPIMTKPGDQIYPAKKTKEILKDMGVKFFASGTGDSAFEQAKKTFNHRKKTSEVSVLEELQWWQALRESMNLAQEEAEEVEEEIYALTKKINEQSVDDYKDRISDQIEDGERWLDQQIKLNNISYDEQIDILNRIDEKQLATLREMVLNTEMTEEEKDEIYKQYYKAREDRIIQIAELEKKKSKEVYDYLLEDSKEWTKNRNFFNDWAAFGDDPISAFNRVKDRTNREIAGTTDKDLQDELRKDLADFGQDMFDQRNDFYERDRENRKHYGELSVKDEIASLEEQKRDLQKFYDAGIIDRMEYHEKSEELDRKHFSIVKDQLEEAVSQYYDAQREQLDIRKKAIEDEYKIEDEKKNKEDRDAELEELKKQEAVFAGAVTIEGKEKLKDIRDQIARIEEEERKERREKEKQSRLDAIDEEIDDIDKREKEALAGVSKHAQQAAGVVGQANADIANQFNALMQQYTDQQAEIAQAGAMNISKIVDWTMQRIKEIRAAEREAEKTALRITKLSRQGNSTYYGDSYTINQTNNNYMSDSVEASAFGSAAARQFKLSGKGR